MRSTLLRNVAIGVTATALAVGWSVASAKAATHKTWHTCVSQATLRVGIYEFDNDLFDDASGPSCITVKGNALTIDRNYPAGGGDVVAYPAVRVGDYPYNRDVKSRLPEQVRKVKINVRMRNIGNASGSWIDDLDIWFSRRVATAPKHIREVIIVDRWRGYGPIRGHTVVRIGHRRWYIARGYTSNGVSSWPLIRFVARTQTRRATISLAAFLKVAKRRRWIGSAMAVDSISDGTECWSGCRGLTDLMRLTWDK